MFPRKRALVCCLFSLIKSTFSLIENTFVRTFYFFLILIKTKCSEKTANNNKSINNHKIKILIKILKSQSSWLWEHNFSNNSHWSIAHSENWSAYVFPQFFYARTKSSVMFFFSQLYVSCLFIWCCCGYKQDQK